MKRERVNDRVSLPETGQPKPLTSGAKAGGWTTVRTTVVQLSSVLRTLEEAGEDVRFVVPDGAYLVVVAKRGS